MTHAHCLRELVIFVAVATAAFCQSNRKAPLPMLPISSLHHIQADLSIPPLKTAATELERFLRERGAKQVVVQPLSSPAPTGSIVLAVRARPDEAVDAYEIVVRGGSVLVTGANARAALYGCYELEDIIAGHGGVPVGLRREARPALRWRLLHPRARGGFLGYRKSDFEFIARCGGNVAHLSHDWMSEKTLFSFVQCPEFPNATAPEVLERNRAALRQYLAWCDEYGLQGALWLCELPCQGGPWVPEKTRKAFLSHFLSECLSDSGTYEGQVVCLAHPLVEQAYRQMIRQLLTDFPQLSMVLVFTNDSNGEVCDPEKCERHRGVSRLEQYNRLLAMIAEEGRKVRPDFQVFHVGWGWHYRGDPQFLPQQAKLPPGAALANLPDGEAWSFDRKITDALAKSRSVTREHGQSFLGYDIFFWGDDTVFPQTELYDFPLGIAAKLRRWQELGADGVFDQWGTQSEYVQADAAALRHFLFFPEETAKAPALQFAGGLAQREFGEAAGPHVLAAWREIEAAQQIQSDHAYYWHLLRPAWSGPTLTTKLTLEALGPVQLSGGGRGQAEPPKPYAGTDLAPHRDDVARARALGTALREASKHFAVAVGELKQALAAMPADQRSGYEHWYTAEPGAPARLSARELLEKELVAVRLQAQTQARMSRFFAAWAIVHALPPEGDPGRAEGLAELERLRVEEAAR